MNVSQFNQALSTLINKAKLAENHNNLDDAIKGWVKVSEFALKASKNPKFDSTYRKMLMDKTEGIIQHIKELKQIKNQPKRKKKRREKPAIDEETREKMDEALKEPLPKTPKEIPKEENKEPKEIEIDQQEDTEMTKIKKRKPKRPNLDIIEDSEFKNLPEGVKEVKTSEDFEIITPYDADAVKKRLTQDVDMSALQPNKDGKHNELDSSPSQNTKLRKGDQKIICFACGQENPPGAKKCVNCGTELK